MIGLQFFWFGCAKPKSHLPAKVDQRSGDEWAVLKGPPTFQPVIQAQCCIKAKINSIFLVLHCLQEIFSFQNKGETG